MGSDSTDIRRAMRYAYVANAVTAVLFPVACITCNDFVFALAIWSYVGSAYAACYARGNRWYDLCIGFAGAAWLVAIPEFDPLFQPFAACAIAAGSLIVFLAFGRRLRALDQMPKTETEA